MIDKNNDFTCLMDLRVKPEDDRRVESGRSMVEMLGVLAVIGVLSVGSIAGYRYAMNKHYANELLAGASERAVLVTAQIAAGREPSLKEFSKMNDTAGGRFATEDESVRVYTDGIGFEVSGVKGAVCENLIKVTEDTEVTIANTSDRILSEDDCDDKNDNTLIITFESGIGNGETGNDICESEFVKIYDCEAKKMVNCCPDNGNSCEDPECSCGDDDDCLGQQVCSDGLCECPTPDYGNSGAPSTTDPSVCCRNGFAWSGNGGYYDKNIACLDEGQEYYCFETDSDGECYWGVCEIGKSSGDSIIGRPYASSACADEGEELYCYSTNSDGKCANWWTCETGNNTGDSIIGISEAWGMCAPEGYEIYCKYTNSDGKCANWEACDTANNSGDSILGMPEEYGACADEGEELYCYSTNSDGKCDYWDICDTGKSSGDSIIGMPDAYGVCAGEGEEVYCRYTNSAGKCDGEYDGWDICDTGKSSGKSIIEIPNAYGGCAYEGAELYCYYTNSDGKCYVWSTCETGKSVSASGPNATGTCNED